MSVAAPTYNRGFVPDTAYAERSRRRGRAGGRALFALVAALVAHVGGVAIFSATAPRLDDAGRGMPAPPATTASDEAPLEISTLVDALDRPDPRTPEEQRREAREKKEEDELRGQVVDIARPAIEQRPESAKFAAEYDSTVDRETRGPRGRDKAGAAAAIPASPLSAAPVAKSAGGGGKAGQPGPLHVDKAVERRSGASGSDGLSPAVDGDSPRQTGQGEQVASEARATRHAALVPPGQDGAQGDGLAGEQGRGASVPKPNLVPNREMLQHAIGAGPGSVDYLKDIDDGDATALNAKKTKFASFFNRLKNAVAQEWNPAAVYVQNDPSGNVYGVKDRVTVLRVVLEPDGRLVDTHIIQSSGVGFLDDEAVSAFKKAQPFANPPAGLVGSNGQIQFTFGFIFELSGKTGFKVYKYR